MKVLLVNPKTEKYSRSVTVPLGLLSIASSLETQGHQVRLYDRTVEKLSLGAVAGAFQADIVGVSLVSFKSISDALKVSVFFKQFSVPVIWGGPLGTELADAVLKNECVDAVSVGEGEATWTELVRAFEGGTPDLSGIAGLVYRGADGSPVRSAERPFLDLGTLPDLDWNLVRVEKYFQSSYGCRRMLYLYFAKGCPHSCAFCYNKNFHRCTYRKRPLDAVLREIVYLVKNYGMDGVYFADELLFRNVSEMHTVCDGLKALELPFVWGGQTRIGLFGAEDYAYMYDAGCRWLFFGIESGSERVLELMNKRIRFDRIIPTVSDCRKAGIVAIGSFIVGYPGETVADARQTVDLIERLDTTLININYFVIGPGSDIYRQLVAEGRFPLITSLKQFADLNQIQHLKFNFSELPALDMRVLRAWYMWRSFRTDSVSVDGKQESFTKKVVTDAIRSLRGGNLSDFIHATISSGFEFLQIFFDAHFHPKVKKKYGLRR